VLLSANVGLIVGIKSSEPVCSSVYFSGLYRNWCCADVQQYCTILYSSMTVTLLWHHHFACRSCSDHGICRTSDYTSCTFCSYWWTCHAVVHRTIS